MTSQTRKELRLGLQGGAIAAHKDIVNFSVRAQDLMMKLGPQAALAGGNSIFGPGGGSYKTTDDLTQFRANISMSMRENATNFTSNISQEEPSKLINMLNRSQIQDAATADQLLLPSIKTNRGLGQQSPFKGGPSLFDNSLIGQKMRKTVNDKAQLNETEIQIGQKKSQLLNEGIGALLKENPFKGGLTHDRKNQVKMNPKVLETWINETLQDAEHLDIPGVILKPEHKNPISRYGIDRLALTNAGIPNEMVDRIFRALFVYSVGFYELIKKCLSHTERKYSIITAIWKVFSILLEYCCKTDYRMLISEISKEHKEEMDKLEKEFQAKFQEQAHNERILKQNMEILQKYNEEIEKDRTNERQMRLKLEEEYMQNTKNHEEEVQLRLKFESKLNNMHSVHRDLETRYKRALNELATLQNTNEQLVNKNNAQLEEITILKTLKAENESRIAYHEEKLQALQREINIKVKQVEDYEERYTKTQDELDLTKYKLQESMKDLTELRLKGDVYESTVGGLKNEKQHLALELKETKELLRVYESKCTDLMNEINKINHEYQESKREIIGFSEIQKERDERIDKLKKELTQLKVVHEDLDLKHGTLVIQYEKVREQYETSKKDLDDAIEKLHVTNKVRHETEVKLYEEVDKNKTLNEIIRDKEDTLTKRTGEIEDLDKRVIELERMNEALEIKKAGIERQYELTKKQLNEKVQNLNDVLNSEKETREMWIERYEKEQKDHTATNAQLLAAKSQLKDQVLQSKNAEIKLQTQVKANEVLSDSNNRLQDSLNEQLALSENLERELNTQKEIMKQQEQQKKEYIAKLKKELETVDSRFTQRYEQISMLSEDYYTVAANNHLNFVLVRIRYHETEEKLEEANKKIIQREVQIEDLQRDIRNLEMAIEEMTQRYVDSKNDVDGVEFELDQYRDKVDSLEAANKHLKIDADQKIKYQNEYNLVLQSNNQLKKELQRAKQIQNMQSGTQGTPQSLQQQFQSQDRNLGKQSTFSAAAQSVDKVNAQVQTVIVGQMLDQQLKGGIPNQQSIESQSVKSQGVRVGGGGEIKKPPQKRPTNQNNSFNSSSTQIQNMQVGGVPVGANQTNEILQSNNSKESFPGISKKGSVQSQGNQSNQTLQSQKPINQSQSQSQTQSNHPSQKNIEVGITPQSNKQMLQSLYPQTTTNQQQQKSVEMQIPKNASGLRIAESQNQSPRDNQQHQFIVPNLNQKQMNDFTSHQNETMNTKVSPSNANYQPSVADNNTIQSSILQSPQGTILNTRRQGGSGQQQHLSKQNTQTLDNSQGLIISGGGTGAAGLIPQDQYYQTIQSNQQLHNISTEDPAYLTNQNILNSYNQQIGNRVLPSGFDNQSVIMEQQYEDEEERGRTPVDNTRLNDRSSTHQNQFSQGRGSATNQSQYTQGRSIQEPSNQNGGSNSLSKMSSKQVVNYNNMNTVMQQPNQNSNKNINNSHSNSGEASAPRKSGEHNPFANQGFVNNQSNLNSVNQSQLMQQRYTSNNQGIYQDADKQENDDEEDEFVEDDEQNQTHNNFNDFREQQISRQNDDSLAQESMLNQSLYNQTMNQSQGERVRGDASFQQNLGQSQSNNSRMKIDINASNDRRNAPHNLGGGQGNQNTSMQSPMSQISSSIYSNNVIQNKFGLQQQMGTPVYPQVANQSAAQNQQFANKQVKGKTSIRSLIKSAATRDHQ